MKQLGAYEADGGSILLTPASERENPQSGITISNGVGDGRFGVFLLKAGIDKDTERPNDLRFRTMCYGQWDVREYDCRVDSEVVATLGVGRTGVYTDRAGNVYFEPWD